MDRASLHVASATGVDLALPIAGAGSRAYAFLIDWHVRLLVALAWVVLAYVAVMYVPALQGIGRPIGAVGVVPPAVLIYLLYHPVLEVTMRGRTPGKRMAGLRIVTRDGGTPSTGALLVRNVFRLIDSLPLLYMVGLIVSIFSRENLRIGDMAAGTVLVRDDASSVAALDALAGVARDTTHDPALIDLAHDVLRRWDELEPGRRAALTNLLLSKLGAQDIADADANLSGSQLWALREKLRAALNSAAGAR